jgi:hypothetical protein
MPNTAADNSNRIVSSSIISFLSIQNCNSSSANASNNRNFVAVFFL